MRDLNYFDAVTAPSARNQARVVPHPRGLSTRRRSETHESIYTHQHSHVQWRPTMTSSRKEGYGKRVLVIDDVEDIHYFTCLALADAGL